jgi:hypothetical protein
MHLVLVTRTDCCLCDEMKAVVEPVAHDLGVVLALRDVDADPELLRLYSDKVPVLLIDGRLAFKYRVGERELRRRLGQAAR